MEEIFMVGTTLVEEPKSPERAERTLEGVVLVLNAVEKRVAIEDVKLHFTTL